MVNKLQRLNIRKIATIAILNFNFACGHKKTKGLLYVLFWIFGDKEPFTNLEMGQRAFHNRHCPFQNCYLTKNHSHFENIEDFDVILFNIASLGPHHQLILPESRSNKQLYVLSAIDPPELYRLPSVFNNYFNLTWTYRLDSDIIFPSFVVKQGLSGTIAPRMNVSWIDSKNMKPIPSYVKRKLANKKIAAVWIPNTCDTDTTGFIFALRLRTQLEKYGLNLDIFGDCGNKECPVYSRSECLAEIESEYYFYLGIEDHIGIDYVSDNVLNGLQHFAVPVVFGGANYSRFMPPGIYLDAREISPIKLAKKMHTIIKSPQLYYDFFRWTSYYKFEATSDNGYAESVCQFCYMLNFVFDSQKEERVFPNIVNWWNDNYHDVEFNDNNSEDKSNDDETSKHVNKKHVM